MPSHFLLVFSLSTIIAPKARYSSKSPGRQLWDALGHPKSIRHALKARQIQNLRDLTCPSYRLSTLWLPDEAKIETEQEEDQMDEGATPADLRRFDKICPQ